MRAASQQTDTVGSPAPATLRVWDPVVRIFHWSLVAAFAAAWLTADDWKQVHQWVGYVAIGLVTLRVLWGFIGTRHARFRDFVKSPAAILRYLRDVAAGHEARYLGHNPAGGAMILALLGGIAGLASTGYMMTTDTFWGVDWVEETHELIANGMLALVALHVLGVVVASVRHGENLLLAMLTGRKRA